MNPSSNEQKNAAADARLFFRESLGKKLIL